MQLQVRIRCTAALIAFAISAVAPMTASAAETSDDLNLVSRSGQGSLHDTGDDKILVLRLEGSWREMGRQYGTLVGDHMQGVWDATVKPVFDKKAMTEDEALDLFGRRVLETSSHRMQEFHSGIADALGWSAEKVALLNMSGVMSIYQSKIHSFAGCSSLLAWGDATVDGAMVTARNMDWYDAFQNFPVLVTVHNPTDGSNSFANVSWPGWFWAQTALNDAGVYYDLHDGTSQGGSVVYIERASLVNSVLDMMAEVDSAEALGMRIRTQRSDLSFIFTVADATTGFSIEISPAASLRRDSEDDVLAVVNSFLNPDWGLHVRDTASNSLTRYRNLRARAAEARGKLDANAMMKIFDLPLFNPDGSFRENGGATKPTNQDVDVTVYQMATRPASLEVWLKVPLKTEWRHIDLGTLFK